MVSSTRGLAGREGTIVGIPSVSGARDCSVLVDGHDARKDGFQKPTVGKYFAHLAPLTDPKSESWDADKVKQLTKPIHVEPTITKERVK